MKGGVHLYQRKYGILLDLNQHENRICQKYLTINNDTIMYHMVTPKWIYRNVGI